MPVILAVDTSAKPVSCALIKGGRILGNYYSNSGLTHSQTLMPMIEHLLSVTGVTMDTLAAVAVNAGPGSFTGVRIGVSAVKGLAFTRNLPCISVSTLESMAENVTIVGDCVVCGVMDARCSQVYTALFEKRDGCTYRISEDAAITIDVLCQRLKDIDRPIVLVGDGSEICYDRLKDAVPQLYLSTPSIRFQNAASTAVVAERKYLAGDTVSAAELLPVYLRLPQAERELNAKMNLK